MKNIIITCGISIFNEFTIENIEYLKQSQRLDNNPSSFDDIYNSITESYEGVEIKDLGTEINILLSEKLNLGKQDNIYFFFSETKGGELVKKLFKESNILKDIIGDYKYNFITISGFKADDEEKFKPEAIKNFFEKLEKIKENGNDTIMCPSGPNSIIIYSTIFAVKLNFDLFVFETNYWDMPIIRHIKPERLCDRDHIGILT